MMFVFIQFVYNSTILFITSIRVFDGQASGLHYKPCNIEIYESSAHLFCLGEAVTDDCYWKICVIDCIVWWLLPKKNSKVTHVVAILSSQLSCRNNCSHGSVLLYLPLSTIYNIDGKCILSGICFSFRASQLIYLANQQSAF